MSPKAATMRSAGLRRTPLVRVGLYLRSKKIRPPTTPVAAGRPHLNQGLLVTKETPRSGYFSLGLKGDCSASGIFAMCWVPYRFEHWKNCRINSPIYGQNFLNRSCTNYDSGEDMERLVLSQEQAPAMRHRRAVRRTALVGGCRPAKTRLPSQGGRPQPCDAADSASSFHPWQGEGAR